MTDLSLGIHIKRRDVESPPPGRRYGQSSERGRRHDAALARISRNWDLLPCEQSLSLPNDRGRVCLVDDNLLAEVLMDGCRPECSTVSWPSCREPIRSDISR